MADFDVHYTRDTIGPMKCMNCANFRSPDGCKYGGKFGIPLQVLPEQASCSLFKYIERPTVREFIYNKEE